MRKKLLLAATAVALIFGATAASAQSDNGSPPGPDPYGYYSQYDHDGYYDRSGRYIRFDDQRQTAPIKATTKATTTVRRRATTSKVNTKRTATETTTSPARFSARSRAD